MLIRLLSLVLLLICTHHAFATDDALPPLPLIGQTTNQTPVTSSMQSSQDASNAIAIKTVNTEQHQIPQTNIPYTKGTVVTKPADVVEADDSSFIDTGQKSLPKAAILDTSENDTTGALQLPKTLVNVDTQSTTISNATSDTTVAVEAPTTAAQVIPPTITEANAIQTTQPQAQEVSTSSGTSVTPTVVAAEQPIAPETAPSATIITQAQASPVVTQSTTPPQASKALAKYNKSLNMIHEEKTHDITTSPTTPTTPEHEQFVKNETIMLILADEPGTSVEQVDDITAHAYIQLFWHDYYYNHPRLSARRDAIELFISGHSNYYLYNASANLNEHDAIKQVFDGVARGSVSDVRAIIDNYPILQSRDAAGNNMLGTATQNGDVSMAKFLLLRGINLYALNYYGGTIFDIAKATKNYNMLNFLESATLLRN